MSSLYNIYPKKKLKFNIFINHQDRNTYSFYKYCYINNPKKMRDIIYKIFYKLKIFGRIYIAQEGINAQISILKKKYYIMKNFINQLHEDFKKIIFNKALNNKISFWMLKVKVRNKIVSDGLLNINLNNTGIYLKANEVNNLLEMQDTIFVDMRNDYEYKIGHFKNAINIPGKTFRDQLKHIIKILRNYRTKKIVMYCTGGIRCEKATAWIKYNNFKKVYQIEGGILNYVKYAREINIPIKFQGKNFVFDHRISECVSDHILSVCETCGNNYDIYINCYNNFCHRLFIQCKLCYIKYSGYCSLNCKIKYIN